MSNYSYQNGQKIQSLQWKRDLNVLFLNGRGYATKITLLGSLKNNRTLKIKSEQEKRALIGSFFQNGGG